MVVRGSFVRFLLCGLLLGVSALHATPADVLPIEYFGSLPTLRGAKLSPNGKSAAMLINDKGTTTLIVRNLEAVNGKAVGIMSTDNRQYNLGWFRWVSNDRLLVGTRFPAKRRGNSQSIVGGVQTSETRLLSVKADGSQIINLLKPNSFRGDYQAQIQDDVIDFDLDGGKHVLLELGDPAVSADPAVFSLDVETGERRQVQGSRADFRDWMVDRNHKVRVGVARRDKQIEIHACDPDGSNWRKLWSYTLLSPDSVWPLGFGKDPNEIYILADHNGRDALFTVNLKDPELKRTLKLDNSKSDVEGSLMYSKATGEVVGLLGSGAVGESSVNFWNTAKREQMEAIDLALPQRYNTVYDTSADESKYLVYSSNDRIAGEWYLGDSATGNLSLLGLSYPDLDSEKMVPKKAVKITARDGLVLPAYLSTPLGIEAKNLPLVLLVHGGPQGSDHAGFDTWVQFLTNRGYAVLQVNFRGSTGFGKRLMTSGLRRWGLEMQDDLADGVQWAIDQGIANSKRVCIVGASFGGYAALMGVAKTPDLYKCAVSFAGVSDLIELAGDATLYRNGTDAMEAQVGSLDDEKERLKKTSARFLAKQIKAPVLLIHGTVDRSVPYYQAELMQTALKDAGKNFRFVKQDLGDHHLSIYEHRIEFFTELEAFLAKNL